MKRKTTPTSRDLRQILATCVLSTALIACGGGTSSETQPLLGGGDTIDSDDDGLTDEQEAELGTNPLLADTDFDELDDGDEVNTHGTNPLLADTDGDTLQDGFEVDAGTDPLLIDTDLDGLSDAIDPDADGDGFDDLTNEPVPPTGTTLTRCGVEIDATEVRGANTDEDSSTPAWNDNCRIQPAVFPITQYARGIQRVVFCTGHSNSTDIADFADGNFGEMTANAVRAFQTENNIDVDAIVGPETWDALQAALAEGEISIVDDYREYTIASSLDCLGDVQFYQDINELNWRMARASGSSILAPFSIDDSTNFAP